MEEERIGVLKSWAKEGDFTPGSLRFGTPGRWAVEEFHKVPLGKRVGRR